MTDLATEFPARLQAFEQSRDVDPLLELFAEDAELWKLDARHTVSGRDGARRFWTEYRDVFGDIASTFIATTVGDTDDGQRVVLEWTSEGTLADGTAFRYPGVSVLEVRDEQVQRFRTYYDSAAFVRPPVAAASG